MSYSTGEALILSLIRASANFNSKNTSRANWKILNSGKSDHYVILRPSAPIVEWVTVTHYMAIWTTVVEVWQRYKDDTETHTDLYARVADIFTQILPVPLLGDTTGAIADSSISGGQEPQEMWRETERGGPQWLKWEMNIEWKEEVEVTFT